MTPDDIEVLDDPLIEIVNSDLAECTFDIRLRPLTTIVTIDVGWNDEFGQPRFLITHALHTPLQADPHKTNAVSATTRRAALSKALLYLTIEYRAAMNAGYEPEESWLVPWATAF